MRSPSRMPVTPNTEREDNCNSICHVYVCTCVYIHVYLYKYI